MNKKLVTIITPSYNSKEYISETVDSVLNQTYKEWEMIIVDDCSTDGSYDILKDYEQRDNRIKVYRLEKNSGCPAFPRNKGLEYAKGDYIAFLDSDDIWHRQKLELQIRYMMENSILFSASELKIFFEIDEIKFEVSKEKYLDNIKSQNINFNKLVYKNIIPNSSVILSKELLSDLTFNSDLRYKAIEDFHMWLRILEKGFVCQKLNEELLFYRLAETSISKSKFSMFKKHYMLYSEYQYRDRKSSIMKYIYMVSYGYFSIINKVIRRKV